MKIYTRIFRDQLVNTVKGLDSVISKNKTFEPPFGWGELICELFDDTGLSDSIDDGTLEQDLGPELAGLVFELDEALAVVYEKARPLDCAEGVRLGNLLQKVIDGFDHHLRPDS